MGRRGFIKPDMRLHWKHNDDGGRLGLRRMRPRDTSLIVLEIGFLRLLRGDF